jgi:regulator of replication initiation timing
MRQIQTDYENSINEVNRLQGIQILSNISIHSLHYCLEQVAKSKEETEELFSAIQEIHTNFEQKKTENTQLNTENEKLCNEIEKRKLEAVVLTSKLDEMKGLCAGQKVFILFYPDLKDC